MKMPKLIMIGSLFLVLFLSTISKVHKKHRATKSSKSKSRVTPKGFDLRNHFGTPNIQNRYGPRENQMDLYVASNPEVFAPMLGAKNRARLEHANDFHKYPGYERRLWPHVVKSGHYDNIAPSATHEINPEITGPKLQVSGNIEYPMSIKTPTFYGFKKEFVPVEAYDKLNGEVVTEHTLINRPVYNYENQVANVGREFNQFYDLRNGEVLTKHNPKREHGYSTIPAPEIVTEKEAQRKKRLLR